MKQLQFSDGKMIGAEKYGLEEEEIKVELTPEEEKMVQSIKVTLFTRQDNGGSTYKNIHASPPHQKSDSQRNSQRFSAQVVSC